MDPDLDQRRQGDSQDGINEQRTADIDDSAAAVHPRTSSSVSNTARTVGENGPSNDEADTELVELTILCAHNLKNLRCFGLMNPRAELYIDKAVTLNTLTNFDGGTNPHWNYTFWFKIDDALFQIGHLSIEIYDWSCLGGDRLIGTARMPMADLSGSSWVKEFFSYQVQVPSSGKFKGVVHVFARKVRRFRVSSNGRSLHR